MQCSPKYIRFTIAREIARSNVINFTLDDLLIPGVTRDRPSHKSHCLDSQMFPRTYIFICWSRNSNNTQMEVFPKISGMAVADPAAHTFQSVAFSLACPASCVQLCVLKILCVVICPEIFYATLACTKSLVHFLCGQCLRYFSLNGLCCAGAKSSIHTSDLTFHTCAITYIIIW